MASEQSKKLAVDIGRALFGGSQGFSDMANEKAAEVIEPVLAAKDAEIASIKNQADALFHLNAHQHRHDRHPFTCGNDSRHRPLIATIGWWKCADCSYEQPFGHPCEGMMS